MELLSIVIVGWMPRWGWMATLALPLALWAPTSQRINPGSEGSVTVLLLFSPDLSGGHDAFAAAGLPPCVPRYQRDGHGWPVQLASLDVRLWASAGLQTPAQALTTLSENVAAVRLFPSSFCKLQGC